MASNMQAPRAKPAAKIAAVSKILRVAEPAPAPTHSSAPSAAPAAERRGECSSVALLEIAAQLIRDRGYAGTTMRRIAEEAGIKAASIYHHYASKDEIVERVLDRGIVEAIARVRQAIADLPEGAPFALRFRAAIGAYLDTASQFGTYFVATRQLLNHVPPELAERHRLRRMELDALWAQLLEEGYQEGAVSQLGKGGLARVFMLGALSWSTEWMDISRKPSDELADVVTPYDEDVGLLRRGLCQRRS